MVSRPYRRSQFPQVAENKQFFFLIRAATAFGTIPVPPPGTNAGTEVAGMQAKLRTQPHLEYRLTCPLNASRMRCRNGLRRARVCRSSRGRFTRLTAVQRVLAFHCACSIFASAARQCGKRRGKPSCEDNGDRFSTEKLNFKKLRVPRDQPSHLPPRPSRRNRRACQRQWTV